MTGSQVRQKFLDYFAARGHRVVRSSSLVPGQRPDAAVHQRGDEPVQGRRSWARRSAITRAPRRRRSACARAASTTIWITSATPAGITRSSKCWGIFPSAIISRRDAIAYAWELITKEYGLPKDRLYVTVFREDDDAEELWQKVAGVPKDRIFRLDEKDNFWQMGETGPCGPCSEIHYDFGPEAGAGKLSRTIPASASSRSGIWCSCSTTATPPGKMTPLPQAVDRHRHGAGAHRCGDARQAVELRHRSARPIIDKAGELFGKPYGEDSRIDTVLRINADHARATAFLIHDGVLPSNEGRGYVLRKIMRRAMRNARMVGRLRAVSVSS